MKGKVKFFNQQKGFGFIISEDNEEIFFHFSGLKNTKEVPKQSDNVEYSIAEGKKGGVIAVDIEKV